MYYLGISISPEDQDENELISYIVPCLRFDVDCHFAPLNPTGGIGSDVIVGFVFDFYRSRVVL